MFMLLLCLQFVSEELVGMNGGTNAKTADCGYGNNCTAECPMGSEFPCNYQGDCKQEGRVVFDPNCYKLL